MKKDTAKKISIEQRKRLIQSFHAKKYTNKEIAKKLGVSEKTIERNIAKIRTENTDYFRNDNEAREWLKEQWSESFSTLHKARQRFLEYSETMAGETSKLKALWYAVQTYTIQKDIILSINGTFDDVQRKRNELFAEDTYQIKHTPEEMITITKINLAAVERTDEYPDKDRKIEQLKRLLYQLEVITEHVRENEDHLNDFRNYGESMENYEKRMASKLNPKK